MFRRYTKSLALLSIAALLSLLIVLYTVRVVMAPQVKAPQIIIPKQPTPPLTLSPTPCFLVTTLPSSYPASVAVHICRNPLGTPIQ